MVGALELHQLFNIQPIAPAIHALRPEHEDFVTRVAPERYFGFVIAKFSVPVTYKE